MTYPREKVSHPCVETQKCAVFIRYKIATQSHVVRRERVNKTLSNHAGALDLSNRFLIKF